MQPDLDDWNAVAKLGGRGSQRLNVLRGYLHGGAS